MSGRELEPGKPHRILAVATQGAGGDDEARLRVLLSRLDATFFPFDRQSKRASTRELLRAIRRDRPDLVVMEGTGIGGGLALILGKILAGVPYVVSSGDAIGPFVAAIKPWLGPVFGLYERRLCGGAAGFIGWSPYLTGRALTFGASRAMTAAGFAPFPARPERRAEVRRRLGIADDALVFGITGSLAWNRRVGYAYGLELVEGVALSGRADAVALIVGDGDGRPHLETLAARVGARCIFTGRVPRDEVPDYLAAIDVASLPQSLDGVGMFRYTTKISEYLAAGLPIVTGQLPLAYDLDTGWIWRVRGETPWNPLYHRSIAALIRDLTPEALAGRRDQVPKAPREFDRDLQVERVTAFLLDILRGRNHSEV